MSCAPSEAYPNCHGEASTSPTICVSRFRETSNAPRDKQLRTSRNSNNMNIIANSNNMNIIANCLSQPYALCPSREPFVDNFKNPSTRSPKSAKRPVYGLVYGLGRQLIGRVALAYHKSVVQPTTVKQCPLAQRMVTSYHLTKSTTLFDLLDQKVCMPSDHLHSDFCSTIRSMTSWRNCLFNDSDSKWSACFLDSFKQRKC